MSKIFQIKRGKKATMPKFLTGEFGMSNDAAGTEELYIGGISENIQVALIRDIDSAKTEIQNKIDALATIVSNKAASSHGHSVDDITGILPTSKGGTGNANGKAPSATNADHATSADSATTANSASSATTAGSCTGNSATATKLATARTIRVNLGSTSTASFDGTANITPGITGTLPTTNGGNGGYIVGIDSNGDPYIQSV